MYVGESSETRSPRCQAKYTKFVSTATKKTIAARRRLRASIAVTLPEAHDRRHVLHRGECHAEEAADPEHHAVRRHPRPQRHEHQRDHRSEIARVLPLDPPRREEEEG